MPPPSKSTTKPMFSSMSEGVAPLSNNLWIGNLSPEVSEADILALFEKHGPVDSITNYSSRGYAFVYFKNVEDAKSAKEKIQGSIVHGNSLKIEFAKPVRRLTIWESLILDSTFSCLCNECFEFDICYNCLVWLIDFCALLWYSIIELILSFWHLSHAKIETLGLSSTIPYRLNASQVWQLIE